MNTSPIVRLTLPFILGMFAVNFLIDDIRWNPLFFIMLFLVLYAAMIILHIKKRNAEFVTTSSLFVFFLGAVIFANKYNHERTLCHSTGKTISGTITTSPQPHKKTISVQVKSTTGATYLAYLAPGNTIPTKGDKIVLHPHKEISPTCRYDTSDSLFITYRQHLFFSGICATLYSRNYTITRQKESFTTSPREIASRIYHEHGIEGEAGALIEAMTTGNKNQLPKSIKQHYSKAGVSHILALSGYHLTIIYSILEILLLYRFTTRRWRWISNAIILLTLWAFTIIAEAPPSLLRATIMCSIMIICKIFDIKALSLNSLAIAAVIMLTIDPLQLFDVGFQLSFISMAAILTIGVPTTVKLTTKIHDNTIYQQPSKQASLKKDILIPLTSAIIDITVITLTCTIFTAPLSAYYFGYISLMGIIANLVLCIFVPILLGGAVLWWITIPLTPLQQLITPILLSTATLMNTLTAHLASISHSTIRWTPNIIGIFLYYILLVILVQIYHRLHHYLK